MDKSDDLPEPVGPMKHTSLGIIIYSNKLND